MARESNTQAEKAKHDVALVCTLEITSCHFSFSYSAEKYLDDVFEGCSHPYSSTLYFTLTLWDYICKKAWDTSTIHLMWM